MKFSDDIIPYLKGEKFSNGLSFKISEQSENADRLTFIESKCNDKRIIHVGFADHIPLVPGKIKANTWLHARLLKVSTQCIGVDIDKEAVDFISKHYAYPGLYLHDILTEDPLPVITQQEWDYMILGEILEHVNDPVSFLSQLHSKYGKYVKRLIISVPNAWDFTNIRMAKNHKEFINTDHRFWFTPYTLAKVGVLSGWHPYEFDFCQTHPPHKWIYRKIIKKYPAFRETLVMIMEA